MKTCFYYENFAVFFIVLLICKRKCHCWDDSVVKSPNYLNSTQLKLNARHTSSGSESSGKPSSRELKLIWGQLYSWTDSHTNISLFKKSLKRKKYIFFILKLKYNYPIPYPIPSIISLFQTHGIFFKNCYLYLYINTYLYMCIYVHTHIS